MHEQRIRKLQEFLADDPHDSFSKFALALEFVNISELDKARSLFEDLLKNDPGYTGLYYHLGKLYEKYDEGGNALIIYNKGIEVAEKEGDDHAASELRMALLELESDD